MRCVAGQRLPVVENDLDTTGPAVDPTPRTPRSDEFGVAIVDPNPLADAGLTGLQCLRALSTGDSADARRVRTGIAETRAGLPRAGLPVIVLHGTDDGLVPQAFSSAPYVAMAQAAGRDVRYWQVRNAQHFDAFLGFPQYGALYLPLMLQFCVGLSTVEIALVLVSTAVSDTAAYYSGTFFGKAAGEGFMRLNFGCPRGQLTQGLERFARALNGYRKG